MPLGIHNSTITVKIETTHLDEQFKKKNQRIRIKFSDGDPVRTKEAHGIIA